MISVMRRRLFAVASAVSLLLCVATVALWVRSYRIGDAYTTEGGTFVTSVGSTRGKLFILARAKPPMRMRLRGGPTLGYGRGQNGVNASLLILLKNPSFGRNRPRFWSASADRMGSNRGFSAESTFDNLNSLSKVKR
jgi:hypothetical protein